MQNNTTGNLKQKRSSVEPRWTKQKKKERRSQPLKLFCGCFIFTWFEFKQQSSIRNSNCMIWIINQFARLNIEVEAINKYLSLDHMPFLIL